MPLAIPPELKKISPFVRRAEELDRDKVNPESRLISYYCRQYAVHIGIPLSGSSKPAKVCLGHILQHLEEEKPAMDNFTRDEAAFLCRKFANKVFDKANEEDLVGEADKNTAKAFYAASTFLQILEQFSEDNDVSEEKTEDRKRIVYAKWKSTEILKAIKEGRTPTPGGYGDEIPESEGEEEAEKKEDAPKMKAETVESDEEPGHLMMPPPAPSTMVSTRIDSEQEPEESEQEPEDEQAEDQDTDVDFGPPPVYPGEVDPPNVTYHPPPMPQRPVVPAPAPAAPPKARTGIFGFGKKQEGKVSKAQLADAAELTRFAMAALEDKDGELAAERLQQALRALGR